MKKFLSVLLLLAMCFTFLVACDTELPDIQIEIEDEDDEPKGGSHYKPKTEAETEPNDEPNDEPADLPVEDEDEKDPAREELAPDVEDFGGYNYKIWNDSWCEYEIAAPTELNGQGINDQVYNRNKKVEKEYNIIITEHGDPDITTNAITTLLNNVKTSGDYFTDLYSFDCGALLNSLAINGHFVNLSDVKTIDFSNEWWDQEFREETTINGYAYAFTGWIQTNDDLHERVLTLNNSLFEDLFPGEDIYEIIMENNAWTLETFNGYWQNVGVDQGTKGKFDSGDRLGFAYDGATAAYMLMACDIKSFYMENGEPVVNFDSDKALNLVDWLQTLVNGNGAFDSGWASGFVTNVNGCYFNYDSVNQHFAAGQILFNTALLADAIMWYPDMEDDVYYLPFPKYDAEQENYYNSVHFAFEPLAIHANVLDLDRTGLITEALGYESDKLQEEVEDIMLQERLTNEVKPRELLLLTLEAKNYDMDYLASVTGFTGKINSMLCNNTLGEFASTVASLKSTAIKTSGRGTLQLFIKRYTQQPVR